MKYKYEIEGRKVVAYCNYAGKRIQASATCLPEDTFDANFGMELAAHRLSLKIARKRKKRAEVRYANAVALKNYVDVMEKDRRSYLNEVTESLNRLEKLDAEIRLNNHS